VDEIVAAGISLVPEGRRLFPTMSVRENLEIGAWRRRDAANVRDDALGCWITFRRCANG
jgi:branched-chain amino acid transport system ATP-binding protein